VHAGRGGTLGHLLIVLGVGCSSSPALPSGPEGTFHGTTADGDAAVVTFATDGASFRGTGALGADPLVISGTAGWCGTGALVRGSGGDDLVNLAVSPDGEQVTVVTRDGERLPLTRGEATPETSAGPFSGVYRGSAGRLGARADLVQIGALVGGVAQVGSRAVAISGRVDGDTVTGHATWPDGSQVAFTALRDAAGTLTFAGFGPPLEMSAGGWP
jgi:hypothetical protein